MSRSETDEDLIIEIDEDDIDELRQQGQIEFRFPGDFIHRDPILRVDYGDGGETQ